MAGEKIEINKLIGIIEQLEIDGPRGKISFDKNHVPILDVMVQEWKQDGNAIRQRIVQNLGQQKSLDFGCGRVGFPKRQEVESDKDTKEEESEDLSDNLND